MTRWIGVNSSMIIKILIKGILSIAIIEKIVSPFPRPVAIFTEVPMPALVSTMLLLSLGL